MTYAHIKDAATHETKTIKLRGWIYRTRHSNKMAFIVLRDSTGIIQCVMKSDHPKFEEAINLGIESAISISGKIKKDDRAPGGYELTIQEFETIQKAETFPISKDQSDEFLLDIRHLSVRTQKIANALKVRSTVFAAIHDFFGKKHYYETQSPILTPTAGESGSEQFEVKYFNEKAYLAQTWQLYAEALIPVLEKIYTIAPSFRAEKSRTTRHLTEYWHAEVETAWANLDDTTKLAEDLVTHVCQTVARENKKELEFFGINPTDIANIKAPFPKITYDKALEILEKEGMKIEWGKDLRTLEERKLCEHYGNKTPIIVTHYPKETMAFYKPSDPKNPQLALCFDMIAPHVGELIGGSERDLDINAMKQALKKAGEKIETYEWYFDTRRYGAVQHAGFGMGVDRMIQWLCNIEHIRDTIPFPRTLNRIKP